MTTTADTFDRLQDAQRLIAMTRIGTMPARDAIKAALQAIAEEQRAMLRHGFSTVSLEQARQALAHMVNGRRPAETMCIEAVQAIAQHLQMREPRAWTPQPIEA